MSIVFKPAIPSNFDHIKPQTIEVTPVVKVVKPRPSRRRVNKSPPARPEAFKPGTPITFDQIKDAAAPVIVAKQMSANAIREYNTWSAKDLRTMVNLKAIGVSYRQIGLLLHRSHDACAVALSHNELRSAYKTVKANLINEVLSAEHND